MPDLRPPQQAQAQDQQAQQPMPPTMGYYVTNPIGEKSMVSDEAVHSKLARAGYNVVGRTPDGMGLIFKDPQDGSQYTEGINTVLQQAPFNYKVTNVKPLDPSEHAVQAGFANAVSQLPDDNQRHAYLKQRLSENGMENPQVIGSGDEYYAFDPSTNKWNALTKTTGISLANMVPVAQQVARGMGMAGGAIAGAGAGAVGGPVGAFLGGSGGAALGEGAVDTGMRALTGLLDPAFRQNTTLGSQATQGGINAGIAGLTGGGVGAFPAMSEGAITKVAGGLGGALETAGNIVKPVGQAMQNPAVNEGLQYITPGLNSLQGAEVALQTPEWLTNMVPNAIGAAGKLFKSPGMTKLAEESGTTAPDILSNLSKKVAGAVGAKNTESFAKAGTKAGQFLQDLGKAGTAAGNVGRGIVGGAGGALKNVGGLMQGIGTPLKETAQALQPYELPVMANIAAEEGLSQPLYNMTQDPQVNDQLNRYRLQQLQPTGTMGGTITAGNQ